MSIGKRLTTTAWMRIEVEIPVTDSWGADCSIEQICREGREAAVLRLIRALKECGGRIVGEAHMIAWTTEEPR